MKSNIVFTETLNLYDEPFTTYNGGNDRETFRS